MVAGQVATQDGQRQGGDVRQLVLALICVAAVFAAVFVVPAARLAAWSEDCRQMGGEVTSEVVDMTPILTSGSRVVYLCTTPDGQVRPWR